MKKFGNLIAATLIFILISVLTAGCGGKTVLPENQNTSESQLPVSQNNGGTTPSDVKETDTYGKPETSKSTEEAIGKTEAATEGTDAEKESGVIKPEETEGSTQAPVPTPTKEPQQTQTPGPKPTPAPEQTLPQTPTPTQAPTPKPTQAPTQAPTPKPTQAPTQAPAQQPSSPVTLPITVSDNANTAAENIIVRIINGGMSEFDKVKAIHDYIVINVEYPSSIDMNNRSLFTAEGALVNKLAVCQGYAEAFSLLCYKAGIQTEMVYGTADNGQSTESHAWNLVRIDGVWYQIDTTWDDPITQNTAGGANLRYNYFLIPDSVMSLDHTANSYTNKYACTDSRYLDYGELQTVAVLIKQNFGDVKYDFASNESEARKIISANSASGVKNYVIVYNMGKKLDESTVPEVDAAINDICSWIPQETKHYSRISFQSLYQYGIKYVMVSVAIQ